MHVQRNLKEATLEEMEAGARHTLRMIRLERLEKMAKKLRADKAGDILMWELTRTSATSIKLQQTGKEDLLIEDPEPDDFPSATLLTQVILVLG